MSAPPLLKLLCVCSFYLLSQVTKSGIRSPHEFGVRNAQTQSDPTEYFSLWFGIDPHVLFSTIRLLSSNRQIRIAGDGLPSSRPYNIAYKEYAVSWTQQSIGRCLTNSRLQDNTGRLRTIYLDIFSQAYQGVDQIRHSMYVCCGEAQVYVRKRPHLDWFLEAVSELFEVVVFTASQQVYAERLLNMIDPQKKWVK